MYIVHLHCLLFVAEDWYNMTEYQFSTVLERRQS